MNKDFLCTYEQSQVLKRLGLIKSLSPKTIRANHNGAKIAVSAPSLYMAARFLREEFGVDLVISPKFNSKTGDRIGYFWRWSQRTDMIDKKTYRIFEAALSAGISAVLEPFKEYYNENP